jgi:RNA polymerase sigma-70 factor (ECF subfamily)
MLTKDESEKQFIEAYDKYSDAIFRYCYYRVFDKDRAKDCVQEAYTRTWKYIIEGHEVDNIRALIYRIANNIIIDGIRKKKSVSLNQIMEKGYVPKVDPREKTQDYFTGQELISLVKSLDEKYREVILMKYVDDLSTKEIAFALNETENNVYVRLSRGLEKVKNILKIQEN